MIGGGDVSPFAGIFSILTIFMVAAAVGLIVGVVIMLSLIHILASRIRRQERLSNVWLQRIC